MFILDMNSGLLNLTYSEAVNTSTILFGNFILQNSQLGSTQMRQLSQAEVVQSDDGLLVSMELDFDDLNEIKFLCNLAVDNDTTYLSVMNASVLDFFGNPLESVLGLMTANLIPDTTGPELVEFSLDMNIGALLLTFSETVDVMTFDVMQITFQDRSAFNISDNTTVTNYTLTGGDYTMENSTIIQLNITLEDLNNIKQLPPLATEQYYTYISSTEMLMKHFQKYWHNVQFPKFIDNHGNESLNLVG